MSKENYEDNARLMTMVSDYFPELEKSQTEPLLVSDGVVVVNSCEMGQVICLSDSQFDQRNPPARIVAVPQLELTILPLKDLHDERSACVLFDDMGNFPTIMDIVNYYFFRKLPE